MAKYYIEVSKYDKKSGEYKEPKIIKEINGKIFENLFEIDAFTASLQDKYELFSIIRRENEDIDEEYNSARIVSRKNYTIIYNEKDMVEFAKSCDLRDITKYDGNKSKSYVVDTELKSFQKIKQLVIDIINSKDLSRIEELSMYSSRESDIVFLINRYMNTFYDNEFEKEKDLKKIIDELKRYKTIRSVYVSKQKKRQYVSKSNQIVRQKEKLLKLRNEVINQNKSQGIKTIEQNEEEFALNFQKNNGIDWETYIMLKHNMADDKEEFLTFEEVDAAYNSNADDGYGRVR